MKIYLSVHIQSKKEAQQEVKAILQNLVVQTLQEKGCIQYTLHQGIEDKNTFVFYEVWEHQEALDKHNTMPYIKELGVLFEDKLASESVLVKSTLIA
ncbi:putative quinol monooxygenase [Cellulophaga baltica]|uniref:Antibiotic biosynthesis monooxygenase n=1 Tax=Cellulophaga baltica 18 TaxID=1348584 RepID=A0AAU8RQD5_9FLAO|nr:putative quinol monooxygenase [Cellulophaga baltica]AIZ42828.1 antibiotic biosynthesis monooxygenase [Cellulophaga baltica 18]MCR1024361.1 antibiotic biosynthesis monooxygenase [Cellulophaga baltica]WFO16741.1 antibiotic biosynthesis monooxygenase [Cellulophaga baltica 4]